MDIGPTELVVRRGYVLEHSSADKTPLWVCEHVTADQLAGHLKRHDKFIPDPNLNGPKSYPQDYKGSGYERGHQAPAGNQTVDSVLKDETFLHVQHRTATADLKQRYLEHAGAKDTQVGPAIRAGLRMDRSYSM